MKTFNQEQVDKIIKAMAEAGVANERYLAEFAVEETGIGNVEDKVIKNHFGTQVVYDYMKDAKSVGIIDETDGIISIAEPFGVVAAVTPTTNPTSTTMFKSLIALKGRNVIILAFHPRAQKCSAAAAKIMLDAASPRALRRIASSGSPSLPRRHRRVDASPGCLDHRRHRRRRHGACGLQLRPPRPGRWTGRRSYLH